MTDPRLSDDPFAPTAPTAESNGLTRRRYREPNPTEAAWAEQRARHQSNVEAAAADIAVLGRQFAATGRYLVLHDTLTLRSRRSWFPFVPEDFPATVIARFTDAIGTALADPNAVVVCHDASNLTPSVWADRRWNQYEALGRPYVTLPSRKYDTEYLGCIVSNPPAGVTTDRYPSDPERSAQLTASWEASAARGATRDAAVEAFSRAWDQAHRLRRLGESSAPQDPTVGRQPNVIEPDQSLHLSFEIDDFVHEITIRRLSDG